MTVQSSSAAGVVWNLGDLFHSPHDPRIEETLKACRERAEIFASRYRGTIDVSGGPAPRHLLAALQELEAIDEAMSRVTSYAGLLYAADTLNPVHQDLQQKVEQRITEIRNLLLFFDLEWLGLSEEDARPVVQDPSLATYSHYLEATRRYRPHKLSEAEEQIINERDNTGRRAFARLFTELISSLTFPVSMDGTVRELTLNEALALLHRPDRAIRQQAMETLFRVLSGQGQVLTFIYDTLIQDHLTMDRLRHYPNPMAERHLANEIDPEAVERLMEVTEANYGIAHDYFHLKAKLLDLPRLALFDQYAPVGRKFPSCTFDQAKKTILEAFSAFSPVFRETASRFFDEGWIDAEIRRGKRSGAFCASPSPRLHPYILCNYTDNLRDVMTLAHELGHGLHGDLARKQTPLNYHPPLTMAETASVFAESLVFDHLASVQSDPAIQLALVAGRIEDIFLTVFRQNVLTRFEQMVFARRGDGRLTADVLGAMWLQANQQYYGDAVEMPEGYRWGWSYIPHFIHTRFYCYSYVFGELLTLSLYRMYREQGRAFIPKYLSLLEAGGSERPEVLLGRLDIDFRDPGFWQKGFDEIRRLVEQAQALAEHMGVKV